MACETNDIKVGGIIEQLCNEGFDGITGAVITLLNEAMKLDRTHHLRALPYGGVLRFLSQAHTLEISTDKSKCR